MFNMIFNNQWMLLLALSIVLFGLAEAGYRIGLKLHAKEDEARRSLAAGVQGAVLGMLGLLLGFTFAMAIGRYETRRDLVLKAANAVGTTWLRAGLLPEVHRAPVKELLRDFVDVRLKYAPLVDNPAMLAEGMRLSADLENKLWKHAEAAATEAPTPITATFIMTLNEMIDTDAEQIAAMRNHIPSGVWLLLLLVASVGCFTSSYGSGAQGARSFFTNVLLPGLIIAVILLIFDLSHSRQGWIGISQQPLLDLKANIALSTPDRNLSSKIPPVSPNLGCQQAFLEAKRAANPRK